MPMNPKDYPDNWKWLSAQVRKRNYGRCELCNAPNGEYVLRPKAGVLLYFPWACRFDGYHTEKFTKVKIVLTVHHIDGNRMNSDERNLISLCQKCHCRLDAANHVMHSKETRKKKKSQPEIELTKGE